MKPSHAAGKVHLSSRQAFAAIIIQNFIKNLFQVGPIQKNVVVMSCRLSSREDSQIFNVLEKWFQWPWTYSECPSKSDEGLLKLEKKCDFSS